MRRLKLNDYYKSMCELNEPCTVGELAKSMGKPDTAVRDALTHLYKKGRVGRKLLPRNGCQICYYLKDLKDSEGRD